MILKTNWIFKGERMIKKAGNNDLETLAKLASEMWHNHSINELINEFSEIMINGKSQSFLKYDNEFPIGFAQCPLRLLSFFLHAKQLQQPLKSKS